MSGGSRRILRQRFLNETEINYLRYALRLGGSVTAIKRGLQLLCQHYEGGRRLVDPSDIRQLIHSHIGSDQVMVRRWALKALGLIRHPEDMSRIVDRLRAEPDMEAQTWGVAALLAGVQEIGLNEVCERARLDSSSAIVLASRLYASDKWIKTNADEIRISLHSDELTLRWATFLIGYGRAPEELFHPRFKNEIFLGELNCHNSSEISEYSIWALWERPDYDASHLRIPLDQARRHPENVRKWLYRLAAKSPSIVGLDPDALSVLARDPSASAREGLALGVRELDATEYGPTAMEWYSAESDQSVGDTLLESMARQSQSSLGYAELVSSKFQMEARNSPLRQRILAASISTPLYSHLKGVAARDDLAVQAGSSLFGSFVVNVEGDFVMGNQFKAGRDINANNLVGGDMYHSANAAVQQLSRTDETSAEALRAILEMIRDTKAPDEAKAKVLEATTAMAEAPTEAAKRGLIDTLVAYGKKAAEVGEAITGIDKLIEAVREIVI